MLFFQVLHFSIGYHLFLKMRFVYLLGIMITFADVLLDNKGKPMLSVNRPDKIIGTSEFGWELPIKYKPYHTTPIFTMDTIPGALLKKHNVPGGTDGIIRVLDGQLEYTLLKEGNEAHNIQKDTKIVLSKGDVMISKSQFKHKVKPLSDDIRFYLEFWRKPKQNKEL
eukprot:335979_1